MLAHFVGDRAAGIRECESNLQKMSEIIELVQKEQLVEEGEKEERQRERQASPEPPQSDAVIKQ